MPGFSTKSIDFSNPLKATANFGINLSALLAKASLVNLDTNETFQFSFNPTELRQPDIQAVYDEAPVAFRSHQKLRYKHTKSGEWVFQLYLNAISSGNANVVSLFNLSKNLNDPVNFLKSLVYPLEAVGIRNRRPPIVRFVWPNLANVRVRVMSVGSVYTQFNTRLGQKVTLVDITLKEDPENNQTSNLVRERGSTGRPGLLGSLLDKLPSGFSDIVDSVDTFI